MRASWLRCDLASCAERDRLFLAVENALVAQGVDAYDVEAAAETAMDEVEAAENFEAAWKACLCWRANCTAKLVMMR